MSPFVSIIIPAFNTEGYLESVLNSLLSQSFADFEIILINDGSTDGTASICIIFYAKDSRILYFDNENKGVATTRNQALELAQGQYVMFVDADDIIYPDSLQAIVECLKETNADLLRFEFKTIDSEGRDLYPNYEAKRRHKYNGKVKSAPDFINKVMLHEFQLCFNVFRRSIIEDHHIRFLDGCTRNEDTLFLTEFFKHSQTHIYINNVVYGYRKYTGAVTSNFTQKNYLDVKSVFDSIMTSLPSDPALHKAIKSVGEHLGKSLYRYAKQAKDADTINSIVSHCSSNPQTIEWKLFPMLRHHIWPLLHFIHRISNLLLTIKT